MYCITNFFGYAAACLTTVAFLPQVIKTIRLKKTDEISLIMYLLFCTGVLFWLIYGILSHDLPVLIANAMTLALALIILIFKLKFG